MIIIWLVLAADLLYSQQPQAEKEGVDSVFVRGRSFLILADSSLYVENDTIIVLPDSIAAKLQKVETQKSEEF